MSQSWTYTSWKSESFDGLFIPLNRGEYLFEFESSYKLDTSSILCIKIQKLEIEFEFESRFELSNLGVNHISYFIDSDGLVTRNIRIMIFGKLLGLNRS